MTHSDSWGTMWTARLVLLSWALLLIPEPGASQMGSQYKICKDCPNPQSYEDPAWFQKTIDRGVNRYIKCPHFSIIKFTLNNGQLICASKTVPWVKELMKCIDGDKKCLTEGSSGSHKEFSKGNNEKPSTTTIVPTTAPATSMEPSTPRRGDNIGQSTEPTKHPAASTEAPNDMDTTPQQGYKDPENLPQGNNKPSENHNEDVDGKMRHMKISIISLVGIVLVLVAVGVGFYCQKRRTSNLNMPCGSGSVKYMSTPDLDSVNAEP